MESKRCRANGDWVDMVKPKPASNESYVPADGSAPASLIIAATDQAFLVVKDAFHNVIDFINTTSMWAFRAVGECEKELDTIERTVDAILPKAITHVAERRARELLACSRLVTELERIADLVCSATHQLRSISHPLDESDRLDLARMAGTVQQMLADLHEVMNKRDVQAIGPILRTDGEVDRLRSTLFRRHIQRAKAKNVPDAIAIVFAAQELERAGDQATNIGEEAYRLIAGGTLRHIPANEKRSKLGT